MRHRVKKHIHLKGKDQAHRKSVIRNLVGAFFENGSVLTTEKRALAITPTIEKLIEVAKGSTTEYNKIRYITPEVFTEAASRAVMAIAPRYMDRTGGYTRITPIKYRVGDAALLVKLELV
jgi:large subunit ribosomal protein L17